MTLAVTIFFVVAALAIMGYSAWDRHRILTQGKVCVCCKQELRTAPVSAVKKPARMRAPARQAA